MRHSKSNEPPLVVSNALRIHSKTRKKALVVKNNSDGLCVSYDRLLEIRTNIASQICKEYKAKGFVCPSFMVKNLFTTGAIDNIDHNLSSTSAKSSIHWSGISIFQHPDIPTKENPMKFDFTDNSKASDVSLPSSYTNIKPMKVGKPEPEKKKALLTQKTTSHKLAEPWLESLTAESSDKRRNFSAFHSSQLKAAPPPKSLQSLLPLVPEPINSLPVVRHLMNQVQVITEELNPGQTMVVTGDQPVYALMKQVQLLLPNEFSDSFVKMGDMHVEKAFMNAIGDWLEGSGWTEMYTHSKISTSGRVDSFLKSSHLKRTRYSHQVTLKVLLELRQEAFRKSEEQSFDEWRKRTKEESPSIQYWSTVIDLEVILFMFVRSLRESDFHSYIDVLEEMMPWFFALDHINYARWMTVAINDYRSLDSESSLYKEFVKGKFTVSKTQRKFSAIGEDQAHEQNNKVVKEDGGAVGLFDNKKAIMEWAIAGPAISRMLMLEDEDAKENESLLHHEDTDHFEAGFLKDCDDLKKSFQAWGNPFEEDEEDLVMYTSKKVLPITATKSVREAYQIGKKQYEFFSKKRSSLYDAIKKNKLELFRKKNSIIASKKKQAAISAKERAKLYQDLFIACKTRSVGDLVDFFKHENHSYPPSLSEYGKLNHPSQKSDFLTCLKGPSDESVEVFNPPEVEAVVIDGAAWVHFHPPKQSNKFAEYCTNEVIKPIFSIQNAKRFDLIFDVYSLSSLKQTERERRGDHDARYIVRADTAIPPSFAKAILRNSRSKTELFEMIACEFVQTASDKELYATKGSSVLSSRSPADVSNLSPCNKEDADCRVFLHVKDASSIFKKIQIVTVDTDLVVIGLSVFFDLNITELWIQFGTGANRKWIPIHTYAKKLGEQVCRGLPFWFAFTGSDTTSQFVGRGKKTGWSVWKKMPEITDAFCR